MRKTLFCIINSSRFLTKLMISHYSMFYNNVTLYLKVLFWLKTCVRNNNKKILKKIIQYQAEQKEKSGRLFQLQYRL